MLVHGSLLFFSRYINCFNTELQTHCSHPRTLIRYRHVTDTSMQRFFTQITVLIYYNIDEHKRSCTYWHIKHWQTKLLIQTKEFTSLGQSVSDTTAIPLPLYFLAQAYTQWDMAYSPSRLAFCKMYIRIAFCWQYHWFHVYIHWDSICKYLLCWFIGWNQPGRFIG